MWTNPSRSFDSVVRELVEGLQDGTIILDSADTSSCELTKFSEQSPLDPIVEKRIITGLKSSYFPTSPGVVVETHSEG